MKFGTSKSAKLLLTVCALAFTFATVASAEPIKDLVLWESSGSHEVENLCHLHTERGEDHNVLCNLYSGLLEVDSKGRLVPAIAKEWGSIDGGLNWTFNLRDDVVWVDVNGNEKAKCTAKDWLTAMEWVMNFHKNGAANTSMFIELLKGAEDYYNYTKNLDRDAAMKLGTDKMLEMVGIEMPNEYTLVYHCLKNAPYFDTLCTSACFYPISQAMIDELGVENVIGMNNEQMWYNGAYTLTSFILNNEKVLTRNPKYWDKDATLFDTVTIRMISDGTVDDQLYETGEVDQCELNDSNLRTIWNNEKDPRRAQLVETPPRKYSYQIHFNFTKNKKDGTPDVNWNKAIANENFRKSLYYGLNLTPTWSRINFIAPLHCENLAYTMRGLLYFSDGTDYVDHVIDALKLPESDGKNPRRYNPELAAQYKAKAIEELTAQGVTFPIEFDQFILAGSQTALDAATISKEIFEDLGTDYIKYNINTYVSSLTQEVVRPRLQSFVGNGWGADYADPENFLSQEMYGNDRAWYSNQHSHINDVDPDAEPALIAAYKEFTALVEKGSNIFDNMDARYQAFVDAEVCLLEHALVLPQSYEIMWQLTHINDYSTKLRTLCGIQSRMYKNWETSTEPYSAADYEKFQANYNAAK